MQNEHNQLVSPSQKTPLPEDYPPDDLSPIQLNSIVSQIKDYQTNNGSLIKVIGSDTPHSVRLQPVSVSVLPTIFPRKLFDEAIKELQPIYNELYCSIAEDEEWLYSITGPLRQTESLVDVLWSVHEEVKRQRQENASDENVTLKLVEQEVHAGIFRSDYMLHTDDHGDDNDDDDDEDVNGAEEGDWMRNISLKQVEFNSYSCAGGCHADKVSKMHRFLARKGVYDFSSASMYENEENLSPPLPSQGSKIHPSFLPENNTIKGIASLLASAHRNYGPAPYSSIASHTAVLMIVQPNNFNIADERPIEYALWNWTDDKGEDDMIPTYRIEWQDVLQCTSLTQTGELLFFTPESGGLADKRPIEVSVVYHRAGYEPDEYTNYTDGVETRIRLELSRAIKCPSVLGHLTTIKRVQQALTGPGVLERWLTPDKADRLRQTFVRIYPLDETSPEGIKGRELLIANTMDSLISNYILKPVSLEGGGHNIYGSDITDLLRTLPSHSPAWSAYILMEKIRSPDNVSGVLLSSSRGIVADDVVSELGVFGGCLWRRRRRQRPLQAINIDKNEDEDDDCNRRDVEHQQQVSNRCQVLENKVVGWSLKTKEERVNEMSVVKGYGCFDTPFLID